MTEDDKFRIELHRSDVYYGDPLAADRIEELVKERERLALAICGGEDAVGYANAQSVEALEKVARDNAAMTMWQIDKTMQAEAKLTKAVAGLRKIADYTHIGESGQGVKQHAEARIAIAVLAELEGQ